MLLDIIKPQPMCILAEQKRNKRVIINRVLHVKPNLFDQFANLNRLEFATQNIQASRKLSAYRTVVSFCYN